MEQMSLHEAELAAGTRFAFGANWRRFLRVLDDARIAQAEESLRRMLQVRDLQGRRFLDAGSGSGLFSLAARRLGAAVYSFDYDPQSVACTEELRRRYFADDANWDVDSGSVLDAEYLSKLGEFDVVYSWGVLHHTGAMWQALENVCQRVRTNGHLFIAIYNDQGWKSRYWYAVKKLYAAHSVLRWPLVLMHLPYPFLPSLVSRKLSGRTREQRGMSSWYDLIDWIGGFPFEVASPKEIINFFQARHFKLSVIKTTNRSGCNEFVFRKEPLV